MKNPLAVLGPVGTAAALLPLLGPRRLRGGGAAVAFDGLLVLPRETRRLMALDATWQSDARTADLEKSGKKSGELFFWKMPLLATIGYYWLPSGNLLHSY